MPHTMELTLMSISTCENEGSRDEREFRSAVARAHIGDRHIAGAWHLWDAMLVHVCGTINSALGTSSTRIVAGEGGGNTTYYASEYGDLNAENLYRSSSPTRTASPCLSRRRVRCCCATTTARCRLPRDKHVTLFGHAGAAGLQPGGANSAADTGKYVIDLKSTGTCRFLGEQHSV